MNLSVIKGIVADNSQQINDPNINLWIMVIVRAIYDAAGINISCTKDNRQHWRSNGEYFLFGNSGELEIVCNAIGLNPQWVRKIAKERLNNVPILRTRAAAGVKRRNYMGGAKVKLFRKERQDSRL